MKPRNHAVTSRTCLGDELDRAAPLLVDLKCPWESVDVLRSSIFTVAEFFFSVREGTVWRIRTVFTTRVEHANLRLVLRSVNLATHELGGAERADG